jgi:hypothetical protein
MPTALPYVPSYGKIKTLFTKIASAKVPDSFTHAYLSQTLGLKSTSDRPLIPLLRQLGFIDASGKPTAAYNSLKNPKEAKRAIAAATREAFAPLFAANENAHTLDGDELKGLVAQVAGTDEEVTRRTVGTFQALVELSDFATKAEPEQGVKPPPSLTPKPSELESAAGRLSVRPEFHYNIQVHLPSNASEETYLNIFNALRKAFS